MTILSVDIGGTKIAAAAVTSEGEIIAKVQQPTPLDGVDSVVDLIEAMARQLDNEPLHCIGVAIPAVLDRESDRVIWAPNLPVLNHIDLRALLEERLKLPTLLEYDGHAAVLGEWWMGQGRGYQNVASIILGTGIGGGFVVDGRLWHGRNRLAGAIGWFPMTSVDGRLEHWEQLAAGPGIVQRAQTLLAQKRESVLPANSLTAREIFDAARRSDVLALQVINEVAVYIGMGIANVISLANPDIVILGGSIGQQGDLLLPKVREVATHWAQPLSALDVPIVSSTLGAEAGLLGAAYAAQQRLSGK
jgi:glucokinase